MIIRSFTAFLLSGIVSRLKRLSLDILALLDSIPSPCQPHDALNRYLNPITMTLKLLARA